MKNTIDLEQNWQFRQAGKEQWLPAVVPGDIFTDLMANGQIEDPFYRENEKQVQWVGYEDWQYRTSFNITDDFLQQETIELFCDGLDTLGVLSLNGREIAQVNNMFRTWRFNVKETLVAGENILELYFKSPIRTILPIMEALDCAYPARCDFGEKTSPHVRKAPYQFGWDWGPRLVTCGVWRPIRLEGWNEARIESLQIVQQDITTNKARVTVRVEIGAATMMDAELVVESLEATFPILRQPVRLVYGQQTASVELEISDPRLWYSNGYGDQPLYPVSVKLRHNGTTVDEKTTRFGLRTLEVRRNRDDIGAGFEVVVNGTPVFAKGGNWIPADSFPTRLTDDRYRSLIQSCQDANMNMLRVWGGGIYEADVFYDLCDELGILVWQDFMFSCSMYPAGTPFLENVRNEAVDQIKRLRNHPCIALWCGNNEMEWGWHMFGWKEEHPEKMLHEYDALFHHVLPNVCAAYDSSRLYWPSSPSSNFEDGDSNSQNFGDIHYWDVWHNAEPFEKYLEQFPRFISEYGFQSFPLLESVKRFAEPLDFDIESPVMLLHQKNARGNQLIREYMYRDYLKPKDFESFLYVSQILQAEGIRIGTEHFRRFRPRCMGTLYWQINDCWPVASWAGIDYYGHWKALHFAAKRFYAPVLISPVLRDGAVEVHVVSDRTTALSATLTLDLLSFTGERRWSDLRQITVAPLSSAIYATLPLEMFGDFNPRSTLLFIRLEGETAENVLYFVKPKNLDLPVAKPRVMVKAGKTGFTVTLSSDVLLRHVYLNVPDTTGAFSNNFFDLYPGVARHVEFCPQAGLTVAEFQQKLSIQSLADAFLSPDEETS